MERLNRGLKRAESPTKKKKQKKKKKKKKTKIIVISKLNCGTKYEKA